MKIPSPRGGPHASQKRFPLSAPRTAAAGRAHALLARGLPLLLIALAALVLSSVGHAQALDVVLVSNTGQTAGSDLATATGRVTYAQSFTTGDHPEGYFLSSVEVGLKAGSGVTAEVALWRTHRGVFGSHIGYRFFPTLKLTTLSGVGSIDEDAATLERFSANDVLLLPATTYWIVVTRTGGADDGLSVATTSSEDAVDAGGMAGFSVGNNVWVPDPDSRFDWDDYSGSVDASMKIELRGSEATRPPGPYATNRNEQSRAAAAETSSSTTRYATSFTTASNPATHQLTSVLLGVAAEAGVSPRVAIHADASGGQPAASALTNGTLTAPADVSRVLGAPDRAEFTASPAISLAGSTRYWVVLDVGSGTGSLSVSTTASDANDEVPQPQWRLGDTMKVYNGTSWSNDSQGHTFRMALNGPTDQYIGPPFQLMREVRIGLPQVGVGVAAEILDESFRVKNATWQWQRGDTSDGTFTDIPAEQGGTSRVYVPAATDLGKWLQALASYENAFGPGKMVSGVSGQAVLSQPIMSNAGQISNVGYVVLQNDTVNIAQAFTTGGNPSGYSLRGLRFGIYLETDIDALSWALHADAAGEPAAEPLFTHIAVPSASLDAATSTFEDLVHPGFPLAPDTKYWAVLTSSPLMEGTGGPTLGAAGISEWGERVILDGPAAELDPGSESGWTLHFSTLSTPHDPLSTEEWVRFPEALELEPNGKLALQMSVLTHPEVTASFGQAAYTVAEGVTQSVTVTLSADPERTVTIPIVTMGQDGASSVDYSGVPDSVTFNAGGPTEMTFTFTATQDTFDDEGESVLLGFGPDLSGGVSSGTPDETTLTITDDDPPEVSFGQNAYTVAEGGMVSVEVKLTSALGSAVTVPVTHTPQGATSAADYSGVPANLTFNTGETSKTFSLSAAQDTVDDDGESVLLTFGTLPATVQTGTTTETTVNITDDDAAEVSFGQSAYTVAEGGMVSVEVKLTSAPASAVTVPVTHTPQGATSSADYSGVPANVMFSAGETSKAFTFTATQDTVDDDGESVLLTFGTLPDTVQTGTTTQSTVTITDDDIPSSVVVNFGSATYTVTEGGTVDVTVILDDDPERTVTVPIGTINEGGASGSDYSGVPATVTFSSGETEKTFTVTATEDNLEDGGEGVKLSFVNLPPEATLGTTNEATVSIINKAAQNSLTVAFQSVAYSVPEGNSVVVTVILSAAPGSEVTVPLTVTEQGGATSADYSGVPASVTFGPDERDQTFTVSATQDVVDDDEESVVIGFGTLSDGVREGGAGNTTVDIRDDDDPAVVVSFGSATYTVAEGDTVDVTVTLDRDPERSVTIPIVTTEQDSASSVDYSGVPANVVFNSGETEKSITFSATQDTIDDDGESVRLAFGSPLPTDVTAASPQEAVVSITDDDVPSVTVSFEQGTYTVAEGGTVEVTVTLDPDPERTVTIPITKANQGTASDADYSGVPANVVFNSGETEKSITFSATQDTIDDDGESVRLAFGSPLPTDVTAASPQETVVSITDDDVPSVTVSFEQGTYTVAEGGTVEVTVTLDPDPERTVTIPITKVNQGTASDADYSGVPANVVFNSGETEKSITFSATQDTIDDDGESVRLAFGSPLPTDVTAASPQETVVSITDDDVPSVVVSFGSAAYTVAEGGTVEVTVTLDPDPERTVTIPITKVNQGTASDADYSGVPANVVFNSGETEKSITFSATQDTIDDDGESVRLAFGSPLPTDVTAASPQEAVVSITDDDVPSVTVSFEQGTYTVAEGGTQTVTVTLSADPERTVTIPIIRTNQDGASNGDYSGVPASVTFNNGDTSESFTFTATDDTVDDDGESVLLTFGAMPDGVSAGTPTETTVTITDDDAAAGKVALALTPATISESGAGNASTVTASVPAASSATTTVTVSVNPADTTTLTGNTTLTIPAGDTDSTGVVTITAVNDDAYTGNRTVAVSGTAVNSVGVTDPDDVTLTIIDDDIPAGCEIGDIWCGTVRYADRFPSDAAGRKPLRWYHLDSDVPEFAHNEFRYKVYSSSLGANPGGGTYVRPPFHIPERSKSLFGLGNLSATDPMGYWEMPNQDYLDWTLYISTNQDGATLEAKLPFNEAKFCCGHKWRWHGLDLYELNYAWAEGKEYKLRIVEDPRADRTPEVMGPPLYLEALGVNRGSVLLRWVRPQVRNDGAPPGVSYKVQWKTAAGMWDTPAVLKHVYVPASGKEVLSWSIRGLTPGSAYDVRVIAVNEAGDSAPSNVLRVHTDEPIPAPSQNQAANSPATGGPGIIGSLLAGETLTATTENIEDEDGLTGAVFAYQWLRSDTDIEGAISSTYTMTDDDAGKAIQVRVTFSDDAGNEESLTSYARLSAPPPPPPPAQQDDDDPAVVVSFGSSAHSVTEGGTVEVTVALDVDPERTVTVPLTVTDQDGASSADYSGVPVSVTFDSGEVLKTLTFSATQDDVNDDGESVKLTFGTPLPARVSAGTVSESTVNIRDDDDPAVAVSFEQGTYTVTEGGTVEMTVTLDVDPERTVTVPLTVTDQDGASPADYSGVPASVTFDSGEVLKTFTFSATQDDVDDDGESVKLTFGTPLPARVSAGTVSESTVNIQSKTPLTASVESAPPSHNGSDEFRIRIAFSEEPKTGFSYKIMRDHAFTVTGGSVTGARRLEPLSNIGWEVVVEPDSNGDVTIVLPATTDCNAQGAICTGDGRPLSNRLEITVSGPGG